MNKNLQKFINKTIEFYEKTEHNIRNADKLTLWVVIALLTASIIIEKSIPPANIIVNVTVPELSTNKTPQNTTIDKIKTNFDVSTVKNMDEIIFGGVATAEASK